MQSQSTNSRQQARAQDEFFLLLRQEIQAGKSLDEIKNLIDNDKSGLDLSRVTQGNNGNDHDSLLESALIGGNVDVFKWLVEEKGLQISEGISGMNAKFNSAAQEKDQRVVSGAREIIGYIDSQVDSKTKSDINLLMISAFYMDYEICKKLAADPTIDLNAKGRRTTTAVSIALSNPEVESQKIAELLLNDDRINVADLFIPTMLINAKNFDKALEFINKFGHQLAPIEVSRIQDRGVDNSALKTSISMLKREEVINDTHIKLYISILALSEITEKQYRDMELMVGDDANQDFANNLYGNIGNSYFSLSDADRKRTQALIKQNNPMIHEFIAIAADPVKLADFVNKLDQNSKFRELYKEMKQTTGLFFPLNIIDDKMQEVQNSKWFFGLFSKITSYFFPLKCNAWETPLACHLVQTQASSDGMGNNVYSLPRNWKTAKRLESMGADIHRLDNGFVFFNKKEERQAVFFNSQSDKPITKHKAPITDKSAKIFCFDWDHTITNIHCHRDLSDAAQNNTYKQKYEELINDDSNVPEKARLLKIFQAIINSQDRLAIVSYSAYPQFMYDKLKAIGLTSEELSKVTIVYEIQGPGKNTHMQRACQAFGVIPEEANVVLIDDDSEANIPLATQAGTDKSFANVTTITCNHANGSAHLDQLEQLIGIPVARTVGSTDLAKHEPIDLPTDLDSKLKKDLLKEEAAMARFIYAISLPENISRSHNELATTALQQTSESKKGNNIQGTERAAESSSLIRGTSQGLNL